MQPFYKNGIAVSLSFQDAEVSRFGISSKNGAQMHIILSEPPPFFRHLHDDKSDEKF